MYTETELREMLRASADRVPDDDAKSTADPSRAVIKIGSQRARSRRRVIAPIAVAASSAAVIAGVVALVQRPQSGHTVPDAASRPATAHRAAPPPRHTSAVPQPRPIFTAPITDVVRIGTKHNTLNLVQPEDGLEGQQNISSQIGHGLTANLVIAPAAAFNDRKVARTHPVAIAGTTGYYDVLRLYPLSAGGHGGSAPAGTIVFRTPDRHWAFASLQKGTHNNTLEGTPVDDASAIVHGFDSLHASFEPGTYRTPLSLGYLPAGTSFVEADQTAAHSKLILASLTAEGSGSKELDVTLFSPQFVAHIVGGKNENSDDCTGPLARRIKAFICSVTRVRNLPGGFQLEVQGTHYSAAETQKVLDHITVANDPGTSAHYFPLRQAVG